MENWNFYSKTVMDFFLVKCECVFHCLKRTLNDQYSKTAIYFFDFIHITLSLLILS